MIGRPEYTLSLPPSCPRNQDHLTLQLHPSRECLALSAPIVSWGKFLQGIHRDLLAGEGRDHLARLCRGLAHHLDLQQAGKRERSHRASLDVTLDDHPELVEHRGHVLPLNWSTAIAGDQPLPRLALFHCGCTVRTSPTALLHGDPLDRKHAQQQFPPSPSGRPCL